MSEETFQNSVVDELDDDGNPISLASLANFQDESGQRRIDADTIHQGEVHSSADAPTAPAPADITATGRSPTGSPKAAAALGPNDTVEIAGGMRTTVAVAESMGFITRNASGQYVAPGTETDDTPMTDAEKLDALTNADPDADTVEERLSPEVHGSMIESVLGAMGRGIDENGNIFSGDTATKLADQIGEDEDVIEGAAAAAVDIYGAQAEEHLEHAFGIEDGEDFMNFWLQRDKGKFLSAVRQHIFTRNPVKAYDNLIQDYRRYGQK